MSKLNKSSRLLEFHSKTFIHTKSKMAVASSLVRHCMRSPARIVVIGLLLVLGTGSMFIYFSFPEDQPTQKLNLMTANLAQQHRLKQNSQNSEEASESLAVNNSEEKRTGEKDSNPVLSQLDTIS